MPNVKFIISSHNRKLLDSNINHITTLPYNCRKKNECPLDGRCRLTPLFTTQLYASAHMELAEWLVYWAPKLASRVRCSIRSSSMMHELHYHKNPKLQLSSKKKKKKNYMRRQYHEALSRVHGKGIQDQVLQP